MWRYRDFLRIRKDFTEVYTQEEDAKSPKAWKAFIPHQTFRELFRAILAAGRREKNAKPAWIYGPYGTGKTYACFVIKHLLEDDPDEALDYLERHSVLRDLQDDFMALREQGQWVVAYQSSASYVTSSGIFFAAIQERVKGALENKGFKAPRAHRERICAYLEEHPSFFSDFFQRYQDDEFASFPSKEELLHYLKFYSEEDSSGILEKTQKLLEKEHILLHVSPEDIKIWLAKCIEENDLAGIWFIWDEFTDFFQPGAPLGDFQELAHATREIPFYLIPVTHVTPKTIRQRASLDEKTAEKLFDRFTRIHFTLAPVTAYELAGPAIETIPGREEEATLRREQLWTALTDTVARLVAEEEGVREEHLKRLWPLHPYTAYLLASIARQHSSSQRSLFKFLKDEKHGLAWFIENCPEKEEGSFWLLADKLWDYFFAEGKLEELPEDIRSLVSFVESSLFKISDEEAKSTFKIVMLQNILYRLSPVELLRPERTNLKLALPSNLYEKAQDYLSKLQEQGLINISKLSSNQEEYLVPLFGYDANEISNFKEETKRIWPYERVVRERLARVLEERIYPEEHFKPRFKPYVLSWKEFIHKASSLEEKAEPYQVPVVGVVTASEDERIKALEKVRQIAPRFERTIFLILKPPFEDKDYENWIEHHAKKTYAEKKGDVRNIEYHRREAENIEKEWVEKTSYHDLEVIWKDKKEIGHGSPTFKEFYNKVVQEVFPYGPESICTQPATLYTRPNELKKPLEIGLGIRKPDNQYKQFLERLEILVSKEGSAIDKIYSLIRERIEKEGRLNLTNLYLNVLQPSPFGLHPFSAGKLVLAYALRNFAKAPYYLWDETRSSTASLEGLRDALNKVFRNHATYYLCASSPEAERLAKSLKKAFQIEGPNYLETLRNRIRDKIKDLNYPLFCFKYLNNPSTLQEELKAWQKFVDFIHLWIVSEEQISDFRIYPDFTLSQALETEDPTLEKVLGGMYLIEKEYEFSEKLAQILKERAAEEGFKQFIKQKFPVLEQYIESYELPVSLVREHLRRLLPEELFCWKEGEIEKLLEEVLAELKITQSLKIVTSYYQAELFPDIVDYFKEKFLPERVRINLLFLAREAENHLKHTLKMLANLAINRNLPSEEKTTLAEALESREKEITSVLNSSTHLLEKWIKRELDQDISPKELEELANDLKDLLFETNLGVFEKALKDKCSRLERVKIFKRLKKVWEEITDTSSPDKWSEKYGLPVNWVLEGKGSERLIKALNSSSVNDFSEKELNAFLDFMEKNKDKLRKLFDFKQAKNALLQRLLGMDTKTINFLPENFTQNLIKELRERIPISNWIYHENRLRKIAQNFLYDEYAKIKKELNIKLKTISPEESQKILLSLIEDPEAGLKILARLKTNVNFY